MVVKFLSYVFVTAVGYMIFRGSNSQKNAFRQNPEYAEKKRMCYAQIRQVQFLMINTDHISALVVKLSTEIMIICDKK